MSLSERERAFCEKYLIIADPQERLSALVDRRPRLEPLGSADRTEESRVSECQTPVWVAGQVEGETIRFRMHADGVLVHGLVAALCEICDGQIRSEVALYDPQIWGILGIDRTLSSTRLTGLAAVAARIRDLAAT